MADDVVDPLTKQAHNFGQHMGELSILECTLGCLA